MGQPFGQPAAFAVEYRAGEADHGCCALRTWSITADPVDERSRSPAGHDLSLGLIPMQSGALHPVSLTALSRRPDRRLRRNTHADLLIAVVTETPGETVR